MARMRLPGPITALVAATLAATAFLLVPQAGVRPAVTAASTRLNAPLFVYRVAHAAPQADTLVGYGFDVLEQRQGDDLFVLGDAAAGDRLRQAGFTATVDRALPSPKWTPPARRADNTVQRAGDVNETYYGGYHTVNAQYAHLDQVAAQHRDLATVVTYGQSWRKQHGVSGGYDLRAICISKQGDGACRRNPNSTRPRFFLMAQIHAREITTGDVAWRWIDELVGRYGSDSAITSLVNSTELWVVPIANPDGVDIVQQGGDSPNLQRKNADDGNGRNCSLTGQIGVDLNRNAGTHWDTTGISHNPCNEVYDGPQADSEVENTALEQLFRDLYPAVRGSGDAAAAPADTRGMMITLHSDASMVLFPWEYNARVHTGNDAALRALAKQMGQITGYRYGQAGEILYNASGGTDDWTYDKLGVASFTIEVGDNEGRGCDGFLPPYSCQASFFWPKMNAALRYAAQHAAAPYRTS
ncbi:M14 family zinc carboxypeptidase [Gandjariella thermophila]|uniref:Zinc carboxypeptidase n=1 Tax=Gandjariella thermophila TaxID=1931992 RepID=A0A4D4JFL2_9PSEU|nr:M14 family zinc carboxypeptidase [Gandjariella thermophila]GDY33109.1 peptidase M14 [Gandjariella thermophila]